VVVFVKRVEIRGYSACIKPCHSTTDEKKLVTSLDTEKICE